MENKQRYFDLIDYYRTETWQRLRSERLKIDNYKCQMCGRPLDLQVHHIRYPEQLGTESVYDDLITLCKYCHEKVETEKAEYRQTVQGNIYEERRRRELAKRHVQEFIRRNEQNDYSAGGNLNLTQISVIKEEYAKWCNMMGYDPDDSCYVITIQSYFRNRRIEDIFRQKARGADYNFLLQKGYSKGMVFKYWNNKKLAESIVGHDL